jgi:nucleotide-binding universal stress UspA family protein
MVVAAVDFEPASARAVGMAGVIAATSAAALRVVHAERMVAPPYFTLDQMARLGDERREATAEVTTELRRFVKDATPWPAELVVVDSPPVEAILAAAEGADLIVLGTHGRRGPSRWWLGSVAERVVRGAHQPVLVTHSDTFPLSELFARTVLVAEGDAPPAEAYADTSALAAALGGRLVSSHALESCGPEVLGGATLVAVAVPPGRSRWALSDVVTETLGRCARPILFLPAR